MDKKHLTGILKKLNEGDTKAAEVINLETQLEELTTQLEQAHNQIEELEIQCQIYKEEH